MKKYILILVVLLTGLGIYLAAAPYRTVADIKTGIAENNSAVLEANIDFQRLRDNLKAQLRERMLGEADQDEAPAGVAAAMSSFAGWLLDASVDSLVTPAGLAALVEGRKLVEVDQPSDTASRDTLFNNARYTYDSLSQFSAWVPSDGGGQTRFVLQRDGLDWKLVNIVVKAE